MANLFLEQLQSNPPVNIAHRGAKSHAPENTLAAFETAFEHGADAIEFDVRLCKPGQWVVIHDLRLNRTTNGRGYVRTKTLREIRAVDIDSQHSEFHPPQTIPTLSEVLDWARDRLLLNIEIKAVSAVSERHLQNLVELLREHEVFDKSLISSFNPVVLRRLIKLAPDLPAGLILTGKLLGRKVQSPAKLVQGIRSIHVHTRALSTDLRDAVSEMGLHLLVWGANSSRLLHDAIAHGVDGIITDEPLEMSRILKQEFSQ